MGRDTLHGQRGGGVDGAARAGTLPLLLLCMAQFMLILDIAIVNVALPAVQHDLGFSRDDLQLVVTAYALTFGGLLLLGGRAADALGRRRVFGAGLALFTLGSLGCGIAGAAPWLVAARALQGIGGALVAPAALSLLTTIYPDGPARNRALGVWSTLAAGGGAAGLVLGGLLTTVAGWRWVFFVNVPIGIAVLVAAGAALPADQRRREASGRLDWWGAITVVAGLVALVYGLDRGGQRGFAAGEVVALLAAALVLLVLFALVERRTGAPLVPFGLFRLGALAGANLATLLLSAVILGANYFLTLYFQQILGYSPVGTGLAFLPMTAAAALASAVAARVVGRLGVRSLLLAGMAALAIGALLLARLAPGGAYLVDVIPGMLLVAGGLGVGFTVGTVAATAGVAAHQQGAASGIRATSQQLGGAIGLAVLSAIAGGISAAATDPTAPARVTHGFDAAFLAASGCAWAAVLVVWALVRVPDTRTAAGHDTTGGVELPAGYGVHAAPCLPAVARIGAARPDR